MPKSNERLTHRQSLGLNKEVGAIVGYTRRYISWACAFVNEDYQQINSRESARAKISKIICIILTDEKLLSGGATNYNDYLLDV